MSIESIEMGRESSRGLADGRPSGAERRGSPRFEPIEDRIWLGWWDGEEFRTIGSKLIDVSRTGAAIACIDGPPEGEDAWFCVVGPTMSGGARAQVVGRDPLPGTDGGIRLRLIFQPRCPDDVFRVALGLLPLRCRQSQFI